EPTLERGQWLFENQCYLHLIYPRFKFRKGKDGKSWQTDSMPMMAAVWRKDTSETRGSITIPQSHIFEFLILLIFLLGFQSRYQKTW
ncbi:MAG: hypothetical protein ACKPEQ_36330, partial [Dolichospermum sp.]